MTADEVAALMREAGAPESAIARAKEAASEWQEVNLPVACLGIWRKHDRLVQQYASMDFRTMPPIVAVPLNLTFKIIDGNHRAAACSLMNRTTIKALIPA